MKRSRIKRSVVLLALLATAVAAVTVYGISARSNFMHEVRVYNEGEYGAILLDFPAADFRTPKHRYERIRIGNQPPDNTLDQGRFVFVNSAHTLPDEATLVWQLARLTDCEKDSFRGDRGCTFEPIPNRVYRWRLSLKAMRESPEGRRTGRSRGLTKGRHTLITEMTIVDDQLKVGVRNGSIGGVRWN